MGFDDRTFTAAILDLAVHGHLKLAEIDKATWLKRRTGGKAIAFMYQHQALASGLFTMAPGAANPDDDASLRFLDLDYFTLFERTLRQVLAALISEPVVQCSK